MSDKPLRLNMPKAELLLHVPTPAHPSVALLLFSILKNGTTLRPVAQSKNLGIKNHDQFSLPFPSLFTSTSNTLFLLPKVI